MIRVVHPGSRIPDPDADFLPIPDRGVKKAPDPGSGFATLIKNSLLIDIDLEKVIDIFTSKNCRLLL